MLHQIKNQRVALRRRRALFVSLFAIVLLILQVLPFSAETQPENTTTNVLSETTDSVTASDMLKNIAIKGRAPKTGYSRSEFGDGWAMVDGCDIRNIMLSRYLMELTKSADGCVVLSGTLEDVYTGQKVYFVRGSQTSNSVQIDHVVALSDAWQKGAQQLSTEMRVNFANDPLNLLPVDGQSNQEKGDSDAASWLPPNKQFRCQYVARQIAVKYKYNLWTTEAENATMRRVLNGCGDQRVPIETQKDS